MNKLSNQNSTKTMILRKSFGTVMSRIVIGVFICTVVIFAMYLVGDPPTQHYLTKAPDSNGKTVASFEAAYFGYLASITGGVIATFFAIVFANHSVSKCKAPLGTGIFFLVLAISLVTTGYAARNIWIVTNKPLSPWFTSFDFHVLDH